MRVLLGHVGVCPALAHRARVDWLVILNRRHLERVLGVFVEHYNGHRPHRALNLMPPDPQRPLLRFATSSAGRSASLAS